MVNIDGMLLGIAIGDAVGVPYEFKSRKTMSETPATDMVGHGSHNQPVGTWSDDTSLALCLAESIGEGLDLDKLADKFVMWKYGDYMVAGNRIFDIGTGTSRSIENLMNRNYNKELPENCGLNGFGDNGNGSVMRILPLAWYIHNEKETYPTIIDRYNLVKKVSGLTHGHEISVIACHILIEFAINIIEKGNVESIKNIWLETSREYDVFTQESEDDTFSAESLEYFDRILNPNFSDLDGFKIFGDGFAVHTLEAAVWCLLKTNKYKDCVLTAVNLGEDTDTTAAVAGGLAGLVYGIKGIPEEWVEKILKKDRIIEITNQMKLKWDRL